MSHLRSTSIVIINHNYAEFLASAIQSGLNQSGIKPEIIVVDDGSTDSSAAVIHSFGTDIIPIFKPAGGHVSAVNAGFDASHGDIVIFLDADDILYPICLQSIAQSWQDGDAKLQFRLDTIDRNGADQDMVFPHFPSDLTQEAIQTQAHKFGAYPWTVSSGNGFARSLLIALLPIDKNEIYQSPDGFLSKMAPLFGNVRSIQDVLGAYRVHGKNAWAQSDTAFRIDPIVRWLNFDDALQTRFVATAASRCIRVCARGNERTTQHLEHRLLAKRFSAEKTPYTSDRLPRLCINSIYAAMRAPNIGFNGRIIWVVWFLYLSLAPKRMIERTLRRGRLQTGRSRLARMIVRIARGKIRSGT
jgi:glycosyltransferase involved in cell wall biosynthesis